MAGERVELSGVRERVGFMQGRLSPLVDGRIQAFPWVCWRREFEIGRRLGFARMEWTLDQERLSENPLMTAAGRDEIRALSRRHKLRVTSITGDCFMQAPFWKSSGSARAGLYATFEAVIEAAARADAKLVVVPLVDNGALTNPGDEAAFVEGMKGLVERLREVGMRLAFESDFAPDRLARFIAQFPADVFGVNFDIGNSASLGWSPDIEIGCLASRIINVHVKDRLLGGNTVPLGEGNADFPSVFSLLAQHGYGGFLILQTARASDDDHAGALARYRRQVIDLVGAA
jgi:hexulose-6-phosphate isomerase